MYRSHVLVCGGTGCTSSGSQQIMETLKEEIKKAGLEKEVSVVQTGCHGLCALGPIMIVYPDASFYSMVKVEDIPEIVQEHLLKGRVVTRLLYQETVTPAGVKALIDTDFYKKQHRIALRNCGIINPEVIEEYIGTGGYQALGKVLTEMTPDDVIQCLIDSGLRGRGGGGFPTGLKWKLAKQNEADQKYVCCNADEGDPGAFMDRSVLEGDPHAVLDRRIKAVSATGALAAPFIKKYMEMIHEKFPKVEVDVISIRNEFFGETITVSGLITGQDLIRQLSGRDLGEKLLLPCNMLKNEEDVFLDDISVEELSRKLNVEIVIVDEGGSDLVSAVLDPIEHKKQKRRQMY